MTFKLCYRTLISLIVYVCHVYLCAYTDIHSYNKYEWIKVFLKHHSKGVVAFSSQWRCATGSFMCSGNPEIFLGYGPHSAESKAHQEDRWIQTALHGIMLSFTTLLSLGLQGRIRSKVFLGGSGDGGTLGLWGMAGAGSMRETNLCLEARATIGSRLGRIELLPECAARQVERL